MTQYFTSIQQFTAIFLYVLIAYRCAIKILLKNVFFQEVKNNIAHALQKKKNVGEMPRICTERNGKSRRCQKEKEWDCTKCESL